MISLALYAVARAVLEFAGAHTLELHGLIILGAAVWICKAVFRGGA